MEGAALAAKGGSKARRRPKKEKAQDTAAPAVTGTGATTEQPPDAEAQPSLSQRLVKSIKQQLSQLGGSKAVEDGEEVEQQQDAGNTPAKHNDELLLREARLEDEQLSPTSSGTPGLAARAVQALHGSSWQAAAVAALLLLLLLVSGLAQAHSRQQQAAVQSQLSVLSAALAATDTQAQQQLMKLEQAQARLADELQAVADVLSRLQRAQADWDAALDPWTAAKQLQALQSAVEELQEVPPPLPGEYCSSSDLGAACRAAAAGHAAVTSQQLEPLLAAAEERVLQLARAEVSAALNLLAADRTGLPDYALAAAGAQVVAHSPTLPPSLARQLSPARLASRLAPMLSAAGSKVHPQANTFLLGPLTSPGLCLPLAGSGTGHVVIRLSQAIRPSALSYEHIPSAIAYDTRSAPRNLTMLGYLGAPPPSAGSLQGSGIASLGTGQAAAPGGSAAAAGPPAAARAPAAAGTAEPVLLGEVVYDALAPASRAVQTFPLAAPAEAAVDHVRVEVRSNHGHPHYTCLYRIRVHGTPLQREAGS